MQDLFSTGFIDTLLRFFICLLVNWFIVHFLYFKKSKRRDFYFTFIKCFIILEFDSIHHFITVSGHFKPGRALSKCFLL